MLIRKAIAVIILLLMAQSAVCMPLGDEAYRVLKSFYGYDKTYPLNAKSGNSFTKNGIAAQNIIIDSFLGGPVPGILAMPTAGEKPYPVVLLLHGINSHKSSWLEDSFHSGRLVTQSLLTKGYAVLALDAQYHGDRAVNNNFIAPLNMVRKHGWGYRTRNMITQTVVDYRRAIDYLETRKEFDISRIGVLGYSMGGGMSFILGATEPRIKTIVACVTPELKGVMAAPSTFANSIENKALLMLMAEKDEWYSVSSAQQLFDSVPSKTKELQFFNSGHQLPKAYARRATDWIEKNL